MGSFSIGIALGMINTPVLVLIEYQPIMRPKPVCGNHRDLFVDKLSNDGEKSIF